MVSGCLAATSLFQELLPEGWWWGGGGHDVAPPTVLCSVPCLLHPAVSLIPWRQATVFTPSLCVAGLRATSLLEYRGNFCSWNSSPSLQANCKVTFARWFKATLRHGVQGNYSSCSEFKDTFLPGIRDSEDSSRRSPVGDLWLRAAKFLMALHGVRAGWRLFLKATELNCLSSTCGRRWGELLGSPEFIDRASGFRQASVGGETDPEIP